jgi:hypothetical protein
MSWFPNAARQVSVDGSDRYRFRLPGALEAAGERVLQCANSSSRPLHLGHVEGSRGHQSIPLVRGLPMRCHGASGFGEGRARQRVFVSPDPPALARRNVGEDASVLRV